MRRTLALAAFAFGTAMTFAPVGAASAAPDCDLAQNCVCSVVNTVLRAAGQEPLGCA